MDTKLNQEQKQKIEEKLNKAREDQEKALNKYKQILTEMDIYKPQHIKKMTEVFDRTQNFESERMLFFKQTFVECSDILKIQNDERFEHIFNQYLEKVNKTNPKNDLDWWSRHFGVDTTPNWPVFEDHEEA